MMQSFASSAKFLGSGPILHIVGILGVIVAGALLPGFLHFSGIVGQIISAAIGAIILLALVNFVSRRAA